MFTQKPLHLRCLKGSEWACVQIAPGNVLWYHNKYLMGYFEFLHGSRIICVTLNILEKLFRQHAFQKIKEAEILRLHLFKYDTIPKHPEEQHLPFKQTETTSIVSSGYQSCNWSRSGSFYWQNPFFICNHGINLIVVLPVHETSL